MLEQTFDWHEWIVVDDGPVQTNITVATEVIRPAIKWCEGQNTHCRNLKMALEKVTGDAVLFIEDDDYYPPEYVKSLVDLLLNGHRLVGQKDAPYYHLTTRRYRLIENHAHASLCQTAIISEMIPSVIEAIENYGSYFDVPFWQQEMQAGFRQYGEAPLLIPARVGEQVVGVKGMPGRKGIGMGHKPNSQWEHDPDMAVFRQWVGEDSFYYERFFWK